jgi:periplasmic copper chaperone A
MTSISRLFSRMATGLVLAGFGTLALAQSPNVSIDKAWVRWLPSELPAAGYLTITNHGAQPVDLVGITSPDYGMAMLHQTTTEGSTAKMAMVAKLTVPAHGKVAFTPGNYHVMLEQPKHAIAPGDNIKLLLTFSDGETVIAPMAVKPPGTTE